MKSWKLSLPSTYEKYQHPFLLQSPSFSQTAQVTSNLEEPWCFSLFSFFAFRLLAHSPLVGSIPLISGDELLITVVLYLKNENMP
jgi:hypothetical protein